MIRDELRKNTDPDENVSGSRHEGFPAKERHNIQPLYTSADLDASGYKESYPGKFPYTRGSYSTMYTEHPWTIRQYAGFSTAEETNAFFKKALSAGQKGLSVAFDLATHRGYDSDHLRVAADVGKAGVAIDSVEDMKSLFEGIPLNEVSVSMTMNGAVLPILACYIVAAEEQGVQKKDLSGTIQNDILKEFMVRNTFIYPPEPSMRIISDIMEYTHLHMPRFNAISVSGYHMQEAGATPVQELAFTIADGLAYLHTAVTAGLDVDDIAPRVSFFFGIGMDFLTEIAKLRAARTLWADLVNERFHPGKERSLIMRMHCQTSGWSLTAQDPLNNIVRTTIEALAGVLGGTQSLHTNSYDEALSLPTDTAARIARNTQLIMQYETDLCSTVDPLAGSYAVEMLTRKLMDEASELIQQVESMGGMIRAIEAGFPQRKIQESAASRQAEIDRGIETIVGVNKFRSEDANAVDVFDVDNEKVMNRQLKSLKKVRVERDMERVRPALEDIERAARDKSNNLMEKMVIAAKARATIGEMSDMLEKVWGRHKVSQMPLGGIYGKAFQNDRIFMEIQKRIEAFKVREGRRPRILVVKLGQDGHDRGARIVASAFADMGFDVDLGPLFLLPEEAARQAVENDVHIIGVSTHAGAHKSLVTKLTETLEHEGAGNILVVAGGVIPEKDYDWLKEHGVIQIFGPGTNIPEAAGMILEEVERRQANGRK